MARPKLYSVRLTDDDVSMFKSLFRKRSTSDTIANRCRILLDLDESHPLVLEGQILLYKLYCIMLDSWRGDVERF